MGVVAKILEKKSRETLDRVKNFFSGSPDEEPRKDYPLGAHLNAVLRFDPTDFILAGDSIKVALPAGDITVMAIGEFRCLGMPFYRYYLKDMDDNEWVLQVSDDNEGDREVVLYQTLDEVFPDDWDFWLNEETGLIGYKDFQTPDGLTYSRTLRVPGPDYARPVQFMENIRGEVALHIDHAMMLYNRSIEVAGSPEFTEFLLVSREIDEDGALVRIMAGVPVNPMSLSIF